MIGGAPAPRLGRANADTQNNWNYLMIRGAAARSLIPVGQVQSNWTQLMISGTAARPLAPVGRAGAECAE